MHLAGLSYMQGWHEENGLVGCSVIRERRKFQMLRLSSGRPGRFSLCNA